MEYEKKKNSLECNDDENCVINYSNNTTNNDNELVSAYQESQIPRMDDTMDDIMSFFNGIKPEKQKVTHQTLVVQRKKQDNTTPLVEKIQLPKDDKLFSLCHRSKNLYNLCNYLVRMRYFFLKDNRRMDYDWLSKKKQKIFDDHKKHFFTSFPAFLEEFKKYYDNYIRLLNKVSHCEGYRTFKVQDLSEFYGYDNLETLKEVINGMYKVGVYMNYKELWRLVQYTQEYNNLLAQSAQGTIELLSRSWTSYYELLKKYYNDPEHNVLPGIPNYIRPKKTGEYTTIIKGQSLRNVKSIVEHYDNSLRKARNGKITREIIFPKKIGIAPIRTTIPLEEIRQIRIVPKGTYYVAEVIYKKKHIDLHLDKNKAIIIDLGMKRLMSIVNNVGVRSQLVRGKLLKTHLHAYNRQIAKLKQSNMIIHNSDKFSNNMKRIYKNHANKINDYLHNLSASLINFCVSHDIGSMGIGYNKEWKQEVKLGKKKNQLFSQIPYHRLIQMIIYKAKLVGINVILIEEDYTSKCSSVDKEPIGKRIVYVGTRGKRIRGKGRNGNGNKFYKANGLFETKNGKQIHSDVNAGYNIGRLAFPHLFENIPLKDMLTPPLSFDNFVKV